MTGIFLTNTPPSMGVESLSAWTQKHRKSGSINPYLFEKLNGIHTYWLRATICT